MRDFAEFAGCLLAGFALAAIFHRPFIFFMELLVG